MVNNCSEFKNSELKATQSYTHILKFADSDKTIHVNIFLVDFVFVD
jgi:hypothetical protein